MLTLDELKTKKHLHFIGIGGSGMYPPSPRYFIRRATLSQALIITKLKRFRRCAIWV